MTIASTSYGQLRGESADGLHIFRGVPFAKPPVGLLRFAAPEPPARWDRVREATAFGHGSLQAPSPASQALAMEVPDTGEDCLYLNIWTPGLEGRRPVMVWIHGGAFVIGAGSQDLYDGAGLAGRGDVVVVTINYRLGIFGFLRGKDLGGGLDSTGNEAILDQVAALRWVREEIANFGGDPANVTVFGESAGAISIATLLGMPSARGLFQKAVLESGSANLVTTAEVATDVTRKILEHFNLTPERASELRNVPAEALLEAQATVTPRDGAGMAYMPVVDGETLPRSSFDAIAAGETSAIAILAGTCADEMKLFAFLDPGVFQMDEDGLKARAEAFAPGRGEAAIATYRAAREARGEPITPFETYEAIVTDVAMREPVNRLAELQSAHNAAVFTYLFTHKSPSLGGMLGACHAIDLPFVFGTYELPAMKAFAGEGEAVALLSSRVMDAWLAFAKTSNPSHEGLPAWPAYEPTRRATMFLGPECVVVDAPMEGERAFWDAEMESRPPVAAGVAGPSRA